ncbi:hypothetical protein [Desulfobulbus alkaliphilus]|uniref:hypothetical protein n=1 Tax=Desulfobulbus alkaliphilus TaxID=869814 RepID=UPI00353259D4
MQGKYFIDTVKLIAYRSETAMVNIVRRTMRRHDDASPALFPAATQAEPLLIFFRKILRSTSGFTEIGGVIQRPLTIRATGLPTCLG